jgi:hypothetical protein
MVTPSAILALRRLQVAVHLKARNSKPWTPTASVAFDQAYREIIACTSAVLRTG